MELKERTHRFVRRDIASGLSSPRPSPVPLTNRDRLMSVSLFANCVFVGTAGPTIAWPSGAEKRWLWSWKAPRQGNVTSIPPSGTKLYRRFPMTKPGSNSPPLRWVDRAHFRRERQEPYLRLQNVTILKGGPERTLAKPSCSTSHPRGYNSSCAQLPSSFCH
jgi:hypothetical protein